MKKVAKYAAPPRTGKELQAMLDDAVKRAKSMSPKELFQTMVDAGIYTPKGRLRKAYGG